MSGVRYTEEQKQWLLDNFHIFVGYRELTNAFNEKFSTDRTESSLHDLCLKRLGLHSKYGIGGNTKFKDGNMKKQEPIGAIRKSKNCTYIKVKDSYLAKSSGYSEPYWKPLQKKIYEDAYGEVPKGKMVIFLDTNKENFDLSNLYCIDRRISAILAKNKWYSANKELTLTAIKWAELMCAMKDGK